MNLENLAYVVLFTALVGRRLAQARRRIRRLRARLRGLVALSAPSTTYPYPLLSFPRFALVIFPAFIAFAAVAQAADGSSPRIAGTGALLLGVNLLRWAAWQFIA